MNEITRFRVDMDGSMEPHEDGEWVLYQDIPQRTWVGLTDEEVNNAIKEKNITPLFTYRMIARTIEAKLKEKNS